jgi:hypothetical protein
MGKQYIIRKHGEQMSFTPRALDHAIMLIRELERGLDRLEQHSPYTLDLATDEQIAEAPRIRQHAATAAILSC